MTDSATSHERTVESHSASVEVAQWPRITLVTPVYNSAHYLEDTILSVLSQGYPNLEFIVIDGASTDGTIDIIRKYAGQISTWMSQPDRGVYDALNKGLALGTGEIMGWLNASDMLHLKGLFVVGSVFANFQRVEWITGRPTRFNPSGMTVDLRALPRWSRNRFLAGANQYIQQESTFWRRGLWDRAGGRLETFYHPASDFELWVRFFRHAPLYSVDALIGGYRFHADALSWSHQEDYDRVCEEIIERELETAKRAHAIRLFRKTNRFMRTIPKIRGVWYRCAVKSLYELRGPDWSPTIKDHDGHWVMQP